MKRVSDIIHDRRFDVAFPFFSTLATYFTFFIRCKMCILFYIYISLFAVELEAVVNMMSRTTAKYQRQKFFFIAFVCFEYNLIRRDSCLHNGRISMLSNVLSFWTVFCA